MRIKYTTTEDIEIKLADGVYVDAEVRSWMGTREWYLTYRNGGFSKLFCTMPHETQAREIAIEAEKYHNSFRASF